MKAKVVKGKGEGAKYIEVYMTKIEKIVGLKPYPGTLNLKIESLPPLDYIEIPAFGKFGTIKLAPCIVNYERAFIVVPEKGKHEPNVIEIVAEKNLKALLGLEDGDFVDLQF